MRGQMLFHGTYKSFCGLYQRTDRFFVVSTQIKHVLLQDMADGLDVKLNWKVKEINVR
jgi:hypothetical protein